MKHTDDDFVARLEPLLARQRARPGLTFSQQEIADALGMTRARVCQLERRIIEKLRTVLGGEEE